MSALRPILELRKSAVLGGLLFVLPIGVVVGVIVHVVDLLRRALAPITEHLSSHRHVPTLAALALLVLASLVIGLVTRTRAGRGAGGFVERAVLNHIPGYTLLRGFTRQLGDPGHEGGGNGETFAPALVEIEDALVPAFVVEVHPNGRSTVFVPAVPTPGVGSIYIMIDDRVVKTVRCVSRWGVGSAELLNSMRQERSETTTGVTTPL